MAKSRRKQQRLQPWALVKSREMFWSPLFPPWVKSILNAYSRKFGNMYSNDRNYINCKGQMFSHSARERESIKTDKIYSKSWMKYKIILYFSKFIDSIFNFLTSCRSSKYYFLFKKNHILVKYNKLLIYFYRASRWK